MTRTEHCALESLTELERHCVVEDRVDDGTDVVEDTRNVEEQVGGEGQGRSRVRCRWSVECEETLGVEWSPTDDECNDNGH